MNRDGNRLALALLVTVACAIRLVHLASAVDSPFTYHLGPDEDYYLRFGQWVAGIAGGDPAEFMFMDPAYGYLLGLVFRVFGPGNLAILLLQSVIDTVTAVCIFLIGRELGRPAGGLYGAFLYAFAATAILYSATFLKATWVANAVTVWTLWGLVLLRTGKAWPWLLYGLLCGYCVALRSNMILLAGASVLLLPWLYRARTGSASRARASLLFAGLLIPMLLLSARNEMFSGKFSPLPNNGGVVLHQLYNEDNPRAESWYPAFAPYSHPTEILRGYKAEAERINDRSMAPGEVNAYWQRQATAYIFSNPLEVARNIGRKLFEFSSQTEVANNRSITGERMFSPVLSLLPSPFGLLFALGLPGLFLLLRRDLSALLVLVPVLVTLGTFAVFFAEARFRFHAVPLLALAAGAFMEDVIAWARGRKLRPLAFGLAAAALLAVVSAAATQHVPAPSVARDSILWGYIKMGDLRAAQETADRKPPDETVNAKWEEGLGFLAWSRQDPASAAEHYRRAIAINPGSHVAHYNLAMMLVQSGKRAEALGHARSALEIAPLPEYRQLVQSLSSP